MKLEDLIREILECLDWLEMHFPAPGRGSFYFPSSEKFVLTIWVDILIQQYKNTSGYSTGICVQFLSVLTVKVNIDQPY